MNIPCRPIAVILIALIASACGSSSSTAPASPPPPPPPPPPALSSGPVDCVAGMAGDFGCSGLSLRKRVPTNAMGGGDGNDIWGWVDVQSGNEYALMGLTTGTSFVDVTDPDNPVYLGHLATNTVASVWRDIKVYQDHAYIVADGAGAHGMQVFDLTRLRGVVAPQAFAADAIYTDIANAHNLAINETTGFAYAVGTNTCSEGLHIININIPNNPMFAGCLTDADVHDTQCVSYLGPDIDYAGREICFSSASTNTANSLPINTHHVGIADVTNKSAPVTIFERDYPNPGFAHQGWLTEDHQYFLLGDELDEQRFGVNTRTLVFDVTDLDAPVFVFDYLSTETAIGHNIYTLGNRVFEANYTSGLRVLEYADLANGQIMEIAYFDTNPASAALSFDGAWSVYPYLPSGNIIVSDTSNGLFILTLQ